MSIVVVEGPDGAGKTTLIKNLRKTTDRYYVSLHNAGPPKDVLNVQCVTNWIERMAVARVPLVCDRISLISEPIYGEVLRKENILDGTYTTDDIKDFLLSNVDRIIYCRPPTSVIQQMIEKEKQLEGVWANIVAITEKYDYTMKMVRHWGVNVIEYDWTKYGLDTRLGRLFFGAL
jgi:hypothetical protein